MKPMAGLVIVLSAFWAASAGAFGTGAPKAAPAQVGQATPPGVMASGVMASAEDSVWVARSDGGRQCDSDSAQALEIGARDLAKAGIRVLEMRKKSDGKLRIQLCGSPTGKSNSYRISRNALPQALALGFTEIR